MKSTVFANLFLGVALVAGAASGPARAVAPDFLTIHRGTVGDTWLLDGASGSLWRQVGESPPVRRVTLVRPGSRLKWSQASGLASIGEKWLVAGRRGKAELFSADGTFIEELKTPEPIGGLVRSGRYIWFLPLACSGPSRNFWISEDGRSFFEVRIRPSTEDTIGAGIAGLIDSQVTSSRSGTDSLVFARFYGGPFAHRVSLDGSSATVDLAYRRTRIRDGLRLLRPGQGDPAGFSSPARDLVSVDGGLLVVLRNFEDVRGPGGVEQRTGTVADLYDASGGHISSAQFPEKIRLVLQADPSRVVGLCADGRILVRPLQAAIAGGIQ